MEDVKSNHVWIRIFVDLLMVISVLEGWWFVALPLGLVCAWLFSFYIEILVAGIVYDSLFGLVPEMGLKGYLGTIVAAVIIVITSGLKRVVRK